MADRLFECSSRPLFFSKSLSRSLPEPGFLRSLSPFSKVFRFNPSPLRFSDPLERIASFLISRLNCCSGLMRFIRLSSVRAFILLSSRNAFLLCPNRIPFVSNESLIRGLFVISLLVILDSRFKRAVAEGLVFAFSVFDGSRTLILLAIPEPRLTDFDSFFTCERI